jgi:Ice-binding-like
MQNQLSIRIILLAGIIVSSTIAAGPSPVFLGTAGSFAILAKTGVSTTGVTAITGDIGVSPVAATYVTGFGLIKDASGTFSTSSLVTGKIYASDYTAPTPTKMTTAIGDMGTAYTNAAGRLLPDHSELYAGDLTGKTLTPGLYKWSTTVLVSAGGVTISGTENDVWIFQIAQNLVLANGAMVTLSGGAQASNIFWQVAGKVTLGTTAAMKGIILCQTEIAMSTGATLNGRALAQTAVTLQANAITGSTVGVIENGVTTRKSGGLFQNYRNQSIAFTVPSSGRTTLSVFNLLGQEVATLFSGDAEAGEYNQVQFTASGLAKGWYFSKLESSGKVDLNKMLVR